MADLEMSGIARRCGGDARFMMKAVRS